MKANLPGAWAAASEDVLPLLRQATAPDSLWRRRIDGEDSAPIAWPITPFLHLLVALDQPNLRAFLTPAHARQWGVEPDALRAAAFANLDGFTALEDHPDGGAILADGDGGISAACLLLPGWAEAVARHLDAHRRLLGPPLLLAPHSGAVRVIGADDPGAPAAFAWAERHFQSAAEPLTPAALVVLPDGSVAAWTAPRGHALRDLQRNAERQLARAVYNRQRQQLVARFEEEEEYWFVAGLELIKDASGGALTAAVWSREAEVLLPEAEIVLIQAAPDDPSAPPLPLPWPMLQALLGDQLVRCEGMYPPRWRTVGFPSESTLEQLFARVHERRAAHAAKSGAPGWLRAWVEDLAD